MPRPSPRIPMLSSIIRIALCCTSTLPKQPPDRANTAMRQAILVRALQLKNNYTDAVYLLSQIQVAEGNTADAITSVKFATQLTPNDPTAFFELGLLQYNAGEYSDAVASLSQAVSLSPNYANAQYFLGLSYSKTGDNADAIAQFEQLSKTNPDNADVAGILSNLKGGKSAFANQAPPVSTPEKRTSPPVEGKTSADSGTSNTAGQ